VHIHRIFAAVLLLAVCGGADDPSPPYGGGAVSPLPGAAQTSGGECAAPTEGCPCAPSSVDVECRVYRHSGTYVSCSVGKMTCIADATGAGTYGPCEGAATIWDGGAP
jgi:hypothetical protein